MERKSVFYYIIIILLLLVTLTTILPFLHLLSLSLSSNTAVNEGLVGLFPKDFTLDAFIFLSKKVEFFRALFVSLKRIAIGVPINILLVILTAYPLSKTNQQFRHRTKYVWFFAFTMFFNGGLIPSFMVVKYMGLVNTLWALILPGAVSVWNVVLLLNFFRRIPKDLEEAAIIDGANHLDILFKIYLPISLPALATILLFTVVGHWNSWFDGILYLNTPAKYPLQSYLSTLVMDMRMVDVSNMSIEELKLRANISDKTLRVAQIFLGALPILLVYPFLQRFFVKGLVVGSVKE